MVPPAKPPHPNTELNKHRIDDLFRRIEHHAGILRLQSLDFFKSALLIESGGLITILTIIMNDYSSKGVAIPPDLTGPLKAIIITLIVGVCNAMLGYIAIYYKSSLSTRQIREEIDLFLAGKKEIEPVKLRFEGSFSRIYLLLVVIAFFCYAYPIGWMVEIIFNLMPLDIKK